MEKFLEIDNAVRSILNRSIPLWTAVLVMAISILMLVSHKQNGRLDTTNGRFDLAGFVAQKSAEGTVFYVPIYNKTR